jgi:hypothetical protein
MPDFTGCIAANQALLGRCYFFSTPRSTMPYAREGARFTVLQLKGAHLQPNGSHRSRGCNN